MKIIIYYHFFYREDILDDTSSSAKCSNTAYGAKPSRTTNHLIDDVINILIIKLFVKWLENMMKERI